MDFKIPASGLPTIKPKKQDKEDLGECFVCMEPYNKRTRRKVVCPNYSETKNKEGKVILRKPCKYECCSSCIRRYIQGSGSTAQCMQCRNHLSRQFIMDNLTKSWLDGKYKKYHTDLLFETEKAKCPEIMHFVEEYKSIDELEKSRLEMSNILSDLRKENNRLYDEQRKLHEKINKFNEKERKIQRKINKLKAFSFSKEEKEKAKKKKFVRRCVKHGCKGFLSQAWKCGLCNSKVCNACLEIKQVDEKGTLLEHVCDEDKVKTVKLLNKDTKPCPCCGNMIMKISGCDQMWCPECKNAWSWSKGVVVHGYIHNPHFFEYQRKMKGRVDRAPGDIPCGGIPTAYQWRALTDLKWDTTLHDIYRLYGHLNDIIIAPIERKLNDMKDTTVLRVKYMLGQIDESTFKSDLHKKKINEEQKRELLHVYDLYRTVIREKIIQLYNNKDNPTKLEELTSELAQCEDYVNNELKKISYKYKRTVWCSKKFNSESLKITNKKDIEW